MRSAKTRHGAIENEISQLEQELYELKQKENEDSIVSDYAALNELYERENATEAKIDALYKELEDIEEILSTYNE